MNNKMIKLEFVEVAYDLNPDILVSDHEEAIHLVLLGNKVKVTVEVFLELMMTLDEFVMNVDLQEREIYVQYEMGYLS